MGENESRITSHKSIGKILHFFLILCFTVGILYPVFTNMHRELLYPANILCYSKLVCYIACIIFIRKTKSCNWKLVTIIASYIWGDFVDSVDGTLARATKTATAFGEHMDHDVFDNFRDAFAWIIFYELFPEYRLFWIVLLFRLQITE